MNLSSKYPNLNLRHLRALHAIRAHGTFARAASALGVVPSALTETIRQLETEVGARLFDRSQRPPAPTPLALDFLAETAPLLAGLDRALLRLQAGGGPAGELTVGCTPSAVSGLLAPALLRFRHSHPAIRLRVHDDMAVAGRALHSDDLRQTEIQRDPFGLACASSHPFAERSFITLDEIDAGEVIVVGPGTGTWQLLADAPAVPADLRLGTIEAHSTISQISMIRAGLGVGLMPRNALLLFGDPTLRFVPVKDLDLWRSLYLLLPTRRRLDAPAQALVDYIAALPKT